MVQKLRVSPPDFWRNAKCKDVPLSTTYDPFFGVEFDAEGNELDEEESKSHAIDFCNGTVDGSVCPIRHECLLFALTNNEKDGIWGGTDEITRRAIRRKWPPLRNGKPREEWKWIQGKESLKGLQRERLKIQEEEG